MSFDRMRTPEFRQWLKTTIESDKDLDTEVRSCFCVGPQDGNPVCPCQMRSMKQVDGRWVQIIDHGPVR